MITVLDIETDFYRGEDKRDDNSPYHPANRLVSVGWMPGIGNRVEYVFYDDPELESRLQSALDSCTLLVGHNIKFDLGWLRECGFKYEGKLWDTMICEYVMAGGLPVELKLSACCERYGLPVKTDVVANYWAEGKNTSDIPRDIVEVYGINDVEITAKLFTKQREKLDVLG